MANKAAIVRAINQLHLLNITKTDIELGRAVLDRDDLARIKVMHDNTNVRNLKDNTIVETSELQNNQSLFVKPVTNIRALRYRLLVSPSPKLAELGIISTLSHTVVPEGSDFNGIFLRTLRKVDLSEIDYMFNFYLLD